VNTELFKPSPDRDPHRRIAFAGRLEEYKGGLRVVKAFEAIAPQLPDWTLTIAGDGPERQAIECFVAESPALDGRVQLTGRYSKVELAGVLASSDFFVYPSRHETFGLVIAEAMSAGLPVVAPDRTAPPEFVDERSGVLVPSDDVAAIARAMEDIALHPSRFDGDAIRRTIVERFGFEVFGTRLLAIYRSLVATATPREDDPCAV
jgi:glycosyltransferase involved in cell wall biosynthesis